MHACMVGLTCAWLGSLVHGWAHLCMVGLTCACMVELTCAWLDSLVHGLAGVDSSIVDFGESQSLRQGSPIRHLRHAQCHSGPLGTC